MRRDDHAFIHPRAQPLATFVQLLFAGHWQAQAVAVEVFHILYTDGDLGAVFDTAQGGGHGLEHVATVLELDAIGRAGAQQVRPTYTGHPFTGTGQVIAFDSNVTKMHSVFGGHYRALTACFRARSDGALWLAGCKAHARGPATAAICN
ncbi:hypothetical protein D3C76_1042000 [compost metagenome]